MNLIYKISALFIVCVFSYNSYAQPGRPNIVKQPPKINGILKATTTAKVNAKIHANSNSVFTPANTHANKKNEQKKSEIKTEEEVKKNSKGKKQKK